VTQIFSIDIGRAVERRETARPSAAIPSNDPTPGDDDDNNDAGPGCPVCRGPALIAPTASEHRGHRVIHHPWLCRACGPQWTTVLHV